MSTPTTSAAPVSPTGSDNPWSGSFRQWFLNITEWIKALSPSGESFYDTRRVQLAPGIDYRRVGREMEIRVSVTGSFPIGLSTASAALVPPALCPPGTNARGEAYMGDGQIGQIFVDAATGDIGVVQQTGATRTIAQGIVRYMID